jgi:hypothetical protein
MHSGDHDELPECWCRPDQHVSDGQLSLFPVTAEDWLGRARISRDALRRWVAKGWCADLEPQSLLEESDPALQRLVILRGLEASGLSDADIAWLVRALPTRLSRPATEVAYSFFHGWVSPSVPDPTSTPFEQLLNEWLSTADIDELATVADRIAEVMDGQASAHGSEVRDG